MTTQIINACGLITIYKDSDRIQIKQNFNPLLVLLLISLFWTSFSDTNLLDYSYLAMVPLKNIIKLRRTQSRNAWNVFELNFGNKIFTSSFIWINSFTIKIIS